MTLTERTEFPVHEAIKQGPCISALLWTEARRGAVGVGDIPLPPPIQTPGYEALAKSRCCGRHKLANL